MRLDLEGAGPAIADVDDPGVFARALQNSLAARRQTLQMHTRGLVGAMLAPHHAEDAQLGERGLASAQKLFDLVVLLERESVLPEGLRRKGRSQRGGHGRNFYCRI